MYKGLRQMTLTINIQNTQFYFQFPSSQRPQFQVANASVLNDFYQRSVDNNLTSGFLMTTSVKSKILYVCVTLLFDNKGYPGGVACMGLDINLVFSDIASVLGISDFQLSTNNYYFLRPLYAFEKLQSPQIIANFTSNNLS